MGAVNDLALQISRNTYKSPVSTVVAFNFTITLGCRKRQEPCPLRFLSLAVLNIYGGLNDKCFHSFCTSVFESDFCIRKMKMFTKHFILGTSLGSDLNLTALVKSPKKVLFFCDLLSMLGSKPRAYSLHCVNSICSGEIPWKKDTNSKNSNKITFLRRSCSLRFEDLKESTYLHSYNMSDAGFWVEIQ